MKSTAPYLRPAPQPSMARMAAYALMMILLAVPAARADWVRNGSAYFSGDDIVITPANANQAGSAWMDRRIDLSYDFDIALQVYLGSNDGGADGLSVVFHNDPDGTAAVGDTAGGGEWVGMHTIWPALSVEIDTYQNAGRGDPAGDHLAINEFRNATDGPGHAGAAPVSIGNVEDGADHLLRLVWNSAATTLAVYFDGVLRITYTNDIAGAIFGGASQVWFGVVGSTGGAYNLQRFQPLIVNSNLTVGKSVMPGAVDPGQTVTYTVTLHNNGGISATVSQIVDLLPADFTYVPGTTTGLTNLDPSISGLSLTWNGSWMLAPGQTMSLAFQTLISAAPGTYANNATVRGADFADLTTGPTAHVIVNSGPQPASGTKPLYLHHTLNLSRIPASVAATVGINGSSSRTWTLGPALAEPLVIHHADGAIPVYLWLENNNQRWIRLSLTSSSGIDIGTLLIASVPAAPGSPRLRSFQIPVAAAPITIAAGDTIRLQITNIFGGNLLLHPFAGGQYSRIELQAETVIHVQQVVFYSAAYPAGAPVASAAPGQNIYIRAVVGDPFGSFDISSAALDFIDPSGASVVGNAPMVQVHDSGAAQKIYEYATTLPAGAANGDWLARVTAEEGTEGTVRHTGVGTLLISRPGIVLFKTVTTVSDPINGAAHAKAIPGAFMQYTITAVNPGGGAADGDSVIVVDPVPAAAALFVGDLGAPGSGPIAFIDGAIPSGLTFTFGGLGDGSDDIAFSNNGGGSWTYTPVPDGNAVDAAVTHVRINPKGVFNGAAGGNVPSFALRLRVQVR